MNTKPQNKAFTCKHCGSPTAVDPSDQTAPADYCQEADHQPMTNRKVHLTYFKRSGKYYSSDEYESELQYDYEIYSEVRTMRDRGILPGLVAGAHDFDIHVLPLDGVPALITSVRLPWDNAPR